jgi:hypothetical protein
MKRGAGRAGSATGVLPARPARVPVSRIRRGSIPETRSDCLSLNCSQGRVRRAPTHAAQQQPGNSNRFELRVGCKESTNEIVNSGSSERAGSQRETERGGEQCLTRG